MNRRRSSWLESRLPDTAVGLLLADYFQGHLAEAVIVSRVPSGAMPYHPVIAVEPFEMWSLDGPIQPGANKFRFAWTGGSQANEERNL